MVFNIILILLSLGIDLSIYFFSGLYTNLWFVWVPFVALPILFILLFGIELLFFLIWSFLIDKSKNPEKPSRFFIFLVNQVTYQLVFFSRAKVKAIGLEHIPNNDNYVILFNHVSNFDHMTMTTKLDCRKLICISKAGNEKIPLAGSFIHKAGYISFDRDNKAKSANAAIRAIRYLRNYGYSIAIAPEGTRNKDRKELLLPFHEGAFKIASKSHKPIVISVVKNTHLIHKNFPLKKTDVTFKVLETLTYDKYASMSVEELKNYTYNVMKRELEA